MVDTTNVPGPVFGPNGFIPAEQAAILAGVQADWNAAFQTSFNFGTAGGSSTNATPQGQITASESAIVGNSQDVFCALTQQFDPAFATGRYQDALARLYFLTRIPSQPTTLQVVCSGLSLLVIPAGSLIEDESNNIYASTIAGQIPPGGTVTIPFAALTVGPIAVPATDEISIYQALSGWDSVTVSSGVLGNDNESRSAFETRRQQSVAKNSVGVLSSMRGAVLSVAGVLDAYVTENDANTPVTINGFTLAAHSVYVAVSGGSDADVAKAAWSKKAPGCAWNGNTSVTVLDSNSGYTPPFPAYVVLFERPPALQFLFAISLINGPLVPSNAATLVQNAIVAAFAGADGGPRAQIGATVLATRFYNPLVALGSWVQILSVQLGSTNTASASFTGAIVGTALTVSSVTGTIAMGQTVIDAAGLVAPGTTIVSGSGTSWVVSVSQAVTSEAMQSAVATAPSVVVQINQVPAIALQNISVTLV